MESKPKIYVDGGFHIMTHDPIVDEVRKAREEYAKQFNYDLDAMFDDLQRRQRESGRTLVSFPPKRRPTANASAAESSRG